MKITSLKFARRAILTGAFLALISALGPSPSQGRIPRGFVVPTGGLVADFFVSTSGSDSNAGTSAGSPWAITSLQVSSANFSKFDGVGKTICIMAGTYDISALVASNGTQESNGAIQFPGGTGLKPNTFQSCDGSGRYSPRVAIIDMEGASGLCGGHHSSAGSFNGPAIAHTGIGPSSIHYTTGNMTIDGLKVINFSYKAIRIGGLSSVDGPAITQAVVVQNGEFTGGCHNTGDVTDNMVALWVDGCQGAGTCIVQNNYIHGNLGPSGSASGDHTNGIIVWGFGASSRDVTIQYNTVITAGNIYGKEGNVGGSIVQYNYNDVSGYTTNSAGFQSFDGNGPGISSISPADPTIFRNNILIMRGGTAGGFAALGGPSNSDNVGWMTPVQAYNNTLVAVGSTGLTVAWMASNNGGGGVGGYSYYNNVYACATSCSGSLNGWGNYIVSPQTILLQDYNLNPASGVTWSQYINSGFAPYTSSGGLPSIINSQTSYSTYATALATNGGISSAESHSITGAPTFTATGNSAAQYQLTSGSTGHLAGHVGGTSGGAAIDMGAWGGTDVNTGQPIAQIGASFAP